MRITGGGARGVVLKVPKGDRVRPATDQTRQAVFNSLGETVTGAATLDLFSGTGAYGLEALSRGAKSAIFVEKDRETLRCLEVNLVAVAKSLGQTLEARVIGADVLRWGGVGPFDLILADPPYALLPGIADQLAAKVADWLAPAGTWVLEGPPVPLSGFTVIRSLGKRDAPVRILQRAS